MASSEEKDTEEKGKVFDQSQVGEDSLSLASPAEEILSAEKIVSEIVETVLDWESPDLFEGQVKWFNDAKGFGFIEHSDGQDVFVHYSVIQTSGFRTLKDTELVRYSITAGAKGLHATLVLRNPSIRPQESSEQVIGSGDPRAASLKSSSQSPAYVPLNEKIERVKEAPSEHAAKSPRVLSSSMNPDRKEVRPSSGNSK